MNWEAVGAIAEFLGAIAVFVTLGYLAVQIRQNTGSQATATYDSVLSGMNDLNVQLLTHPDLLELFLEANDDPSALGETEGARYVLMLRCYANQWLKIFRLYERGVLSEAEWGRFAAEAAQILGTKGGRSFLSQNRLYEELAQELTRFERGTMSQFRFSAK
jgi:hypothetical protein